MANKVTDDTRTKRVVSATEGVLRWLGFLQQYTLRVSFVDSLKGEYRHGDNEQDCRVTTGYPYAWAHLTWRRTYVDQADVEALEEVAVHEALHVLLFSPLDALLEDRMPVKVWNRYMEQQERIVDQVSHYLSRRRPKYGYHPSGVPNTKKTAQEPRRRSTR